MGRPLTIPEVGRLFGLALPPPKGKAKCPFRKHVRRDKTFRIYFSRLKGEQIWKCWSCDEPDNVGDAIALYARLAGVDRKTAFKRLKDDGFDMPGSSQSGQSAARDDADREAYKKAQQGSAHGIPTHGVPPPRVLPFNVAQWEKWRAYSAGALAKFAELRGMPEAFLREHGMVEIPGGYVGFTYFDPMTRKPCRVKIRSVERGKWWVEPREKDSDASALGPLYLSHTLTKIGGKEPAILVEGEIDALSLLYAGILNVVSLPDGSESSKTADLRPLAGRYSPWLIATDDDVPGEQSFRVLEARARLTPAVRVKWRRLVIDGGTEDLQSFKDANDALRGGFRQADFLNCLDVASAGRFSGRLPWRLAG
jgi:hypothetical protein